MIGEKEFYCYILFLDFYCSIFYFVRGSLKFETSPELFGDHLEDDTRLMFDAKYADTKIPGNIIILSNGFYIFITLLENVQKLLQSHLCFDTRLDSDNSHNYVDISKSSKGLDYENAVLGSYTYTRINYLPAFYRKGNVRLLLLMARKKKYVSMHLWLWAT